MRLYRLAGPGKPEDLRPTDAPDSTPGPGEVLVRVRAVSLNFRDLMILGGKYSRGGVRPGMVPVSDGAGEVAAVGPGVTRVKVGDRVAGIFHQAWLAGETSDAAVGRALGGDVDGMLAEQVVLPADGVVHVPEHLSFQEAATLPCAAVTAWDALFNGPRPVRPGDTVLTLGTGGVSVFAIQFATAAGARVIVTSSSDAKLGRAKELGAAHGINYKSTPDWEQAALKLTAGRGVDHVVEVGGAGTMARSLQAARRGGTVSVIGALSGGGQIDPMVVLIRGVVLRGVYVGSRATFEAMNRAIDVHQLRPVIDRVFPFEQAGAAYAHQASGAHFGKVVISVG
jgi:NADPH:quinone reductase-like Zn-dependent oxidoreductase